MSQSALSDSANDPAEDVTALTTGAAIRPILDALDDTACRAILGATSGERLSAKELSVRCDLPLSTTYRKLDLLTTIGLLGERIRICQSGKHASEYERRVEDVRISLGPDGIGELRLSRSESGLSRSPPLSSGGRDAPRQSV